MKIHRHTLQEFILFPYSLYKNNPYWVPPLIQDAKKITEGKTPLFKKGPYQHYIVKEGNNVIERITCGIDERFNELKNTREVYFTLFETTNDNRVGELLFKEVERFAREKGMKSIKGPISPTNGDDFRGILVENFTSPPTLLEAYNPPYYKEILEKMDFKPFYELYSYLFDLEKLNLGKYENGTGYAKEKYGFYIKAYSPSMVKENMEKEQNLSLCL